MDEAEFDSLLRAANANAAWAWERLYREFAPRALGFLRLRAPDIADDVLGDVFLDVVRRLDSFSGGPGAFQAWLFRIAQNRLVDELRRGQRRDALLDRELGPDSAPDVAVGALEREGQRRLVALLSVLPEDQRTAVYLRTVVGMSFDEVAGVMDRSVGSTKMLHGRAMRTLATRIPPGDRP